MVSYPEVLLTNNSLSKQVQTLLFLIIRGGFSGMLPAPSVDCVHARSLALDEKIKDQNPWTGFRWVFFKSALLHVKRATAGVCQMDLAGSRRVLLIGSVTCAEVEVCNASRSL